ncbi:MAG: 16S rRNA (cytosine(967)-C(5))-methyltransferase RsmB [Terriglobia bacterium]|jgi:16S rRNA (cytosine967-C5)-methyltransferase
MPISPGRNVAYQVLRRLESGRNFAVDLLQALEVSALKDADRRLATEIVMGVLRWRGELDFQIEQLSGRSVKGLDAEVRTILRMGAYQIRFLERVPKRAVVDDAVELTKAARKRSAAGMVNAVLRKCEPPKERVLGRDFERLSAESRESVRRAFPAWLVKRWEGITATTTESGEVGAARLALASLQTPRTTLRVVNAGTNLEGIRQELEAEGVATSCCEYAEAHGLTVDSGQVLNTRAYREGRVVIQEEASQLVAELVSPEPVQRVLDLCAAPGMKAGQLAQMLGSGTLLACDRSAKRLRTLAKLLPKWVPAAVRLSMVRLDAARALPFGAKFERILLDAPCSGTGTLARNPEIKWRLDPADITRLAELQSMMLRNALAALASGGRLVYATCSLEPEENEGVVEKVLSEQPAFRVLTSHKLAQEYPRLIPLFDSRGYFRTRPDQHPMDGFSAAVIVRKGSED